MVGTGRFELPTPRTPSECSTRLSHVPTRKESAVSTPADRVDSRILHYPAQLMWRQPPRLSKLGRSPAPSPSLQFGFQACATNARDLSPLALRFSPCLPEPRQRRQRLDLLKQRELNLLLHRINAVNQYANSLPQAVSFARALANDLLRAFVIHVAVVDQRVQRHQPFYEQIGQFDKESKLGDARDQPVEVVADSILHELHFLPFHQFALGVVRSALGLARLLGDVMQLVERNRPAQGLEMRGLSSLRPRRRFCLRTRFLCGDTRVPHISHLLRDVEVLT